MNRYLRISSLVALLLLMSSSESFAIKKVAARYNVMEFAVSSGKPIGSYSQIGIGSYGQEFYGASSVGYEIDASDLYKNSMQYSLTYGQLINENILYNIGFSYTNVQHKEEFEDEIYIYTYPESIKLKMYNFDINWNYYLLSPIKNSFAPFVGAGLQAGLFSASVKSFSSESDFISATALNFGADLTLMKTADKMGTLAVSSTNSYQFYASDSRPKYLSFGLSLKYFFRP